jgi:hypothetical protein
LIKYCNISEVCKIFSGNSINEKIKKEKYCKDKDGMEYISTKDIGYNLKINYKNGVKIPHNDLDKFRIAPSNTVFICAEGGSAGRKLAISDRQLCFVNKLFAIVSSEKVLPKFIFQLKNNNNLTVTDKLSTRFFVTIDDAVKSVLTSMQIMRGGEVFIPKTINAIKIYDLASALCEVFKMSQSKIKLIGLRQGEKIHEKIITENEFYKLKVYNDIYLIDYMNLHKFSKIKKIMNFFNSEKANSLSVDKIISYLKKFNLLEI